MRRSELAALAPPGGAVGVALAAVEDAAAAADAGAAVFVDGEAMAVAGPDRGEHLGAGGVEDGAELVVADGGERAPGVDLGGEAGLALEDVADAGGEALVEQGVAEGAALVAGAELGEDPVEVEVRGEDVGTEACQLGVDRDAARGQHPESRAAELDRLGALAGEHRPGRGARPAPAGAPPVDVPAAAHPQVAVEDERSEEHKA